MLPQFIFVCLDLWRSFKTQSFIRIRLLYEDLSKKKEHTLQLRVDHERPTITISQNRRILNTHTIARQSLIIPARNIRIIDQHAQHVQLLCDLNGRLELAKIRHPTRLHQVHAILLGEAAHIRDKGRD